MYTEINFKTKKELRAAVKAGKVVRVFQPGPFSGPFMSEEVSLEGPHYPAPHTWYARVKIKDMKVVRVIS